MEAGGVGCADNRCQNNKPNEFGLNGKWRQVFCNREQKMGSGLEKIEKASRWLTGMGKEKKQENESSLKEKKQGYVK